MSSVTVDVSFTGEERFKPGTNLDVWRSKMEQASSEITQTIAESLVRKFKVSLIVTIRNDQLQALLDYCREKNMQVIQGGRVLSVIATIPGDPPDDHVSD